MNEPEMKVFRCVKADGSGGVLVHGHYYTGYEAGGNQIDLMNGQGLWDADRFEEQRPKESGEAPPPEPDLRTITLVLPLVEARKIERAIEQLYWWHEGYVDGSGAHERLNAPTTLSRFSSDYLRRKLEEAR